MKIFGIGTDIVNIKRIEQSLKKNKSTFINKIFSEKEISYCENKKNSSAFYAKRFAAKEAFCKAIGTGFRDGFNFRDISIVNNKLGKPFILITDKINKIIKNQFKVSSFNFFLSISDEKKYSLAYVVLQKK